MNVQQQAPPQQGAQQQVQQQQVQQPVLPQIIMGQWEETYGGSGVFNALMGGAPLADWSDIDANIERTVAVTTLHYRPINPVYDSKGHSKRTKGLEMKLTKGKSMDLAQFQKSVWNHLAQHGLDTISYLQDPFDDDRVVNVVENHARFNKNATAIQEACETMSNNFDRWDKDNDACAKQFLLDSIDRSILDEMKNKIKESDTFTSVWLKLVQHVLTTSVSRFDNLKQKIRTMDPRSYVGQDVSLMADDYTNIANELIAAGCYDHNLTLSMVEGFLKAGDGNSRYEFPLLAKELRLTEELPQIPFMATDEATDHMADRQLDFQSICNTAADTYRSLRDNNNWGPAKLPGRRCAINVASHDDSNGAKDNFTVEDIANEVLNLVQSKSGGSYEKKKVSCYNCGGHHFARDCPKKESSQWTNNKHRDNRKSTTGKKAWQRVPPKDGAPSTKIVDGKKFHYCKKCRRWTTTHTTETHVSKNDSNKSTSNNDNGGSALALEWRPSLWLVECDDDLSSTPAKGGMPTATPTTSPSWIPFFQRLYLGITLGYFFWSTFSMTADDLSFMLPYLHQLQVHLFQLQTLVQASLPYLKLAFAPILYFYAGYTACNLNTCPSVSNNDIIASKVQRPSSMQRRMSKSSSTRNSWSACKRRLLRTLPLRLRNDTVDYEHYDTPRIQNHLNFNQPLLEEQLQPTLMHPLQHQACMGKSTCHVHCQCQNQFMRANCNTCSKIGGHAKSHCNNGRYKGRRRNKSRHHQNKPHQQSNSHHPRSNGSAHGMADVFMMSTKEAVITDPHRLYKAVGDNHSFPLIWDSGASISVTHDRSDFINFQRTNATVDGVCSTHNQVTGKGIVEWHVPDVRGKTRILKLEAFYIPNSRTRLISTQGVLNKYGDEMITIQDGVLCLSGSEHDDNRNAVRAPINPRNSLPTSVGLHREALSIGVCQLSKAIDITNAKNKNLTEAEKELLRWHCRLGHVGIKKVQNLMRTGVLSHSETTRRLHSSASKTKQHGPYCASCLFGKQGQRPSPGLAPRTAIRDRRGVSKADNLFPGQEISVDHFICSTKGRLFSGRGKAPDHQLYSGGCIFVDHATGYVHVEFQQSLSSHATLESKSKFEEACRDFGVIPQKFLADNGGAFTSKAFSDHLATFNQTIRFAGVGAHHHNGIAERNIRTVMSVARTMMLHSAVHWNEIADTSLWPMAVAQAVHIWNHMPSERSGLSPMDLFSKSRWPTAKFQDFHVWGCPVYVLDKTIADGKKIPRWEPRSHRGMYVGMSPKHASSVPLVLNLQTGSITPQFHVVFDDWFATVSTNDDNMPDFNSDEWSKMFGESAYQYIQMDDDDDEVLEAYEGVPVQFDDIYGMEPPNLTANPHAPVPITQRQPVPVPPLRLAPVPVPAPLPVPTTAPTPAPTAMLTHIPRGNLPTNSNVSSATTHPAPSAPPLPVHNSNSSTNSWQTVGQNNRVIPNPPSTNASAVSTNNARRRSSRHRTQPDRLNIADNKGNKTYTAMQLAVHFVNMFTTTGDIPPEPAVMKASKSKSNPDVLTFDEAMNDGDRVSQWMESMKREIDELEDKDVWDIVPVTEPAEINAQIVPSTWTLRYKRAPDGTIKKMKARFCMRGDLQQDVNEPSYSPVVAFTTVRLFLIVALTLGWKTCSIDYSNAFVQAVLKKPVYLQMPRGFHGPDQGKFCLKLKRSLYGSTFAPKLWYEHLFKFLVQKEGFTPSKHDPCLLFKDDIMIINYVDDSGIAYKSEEVLESFLVRLGNNGFGYTREGSFTEYLGIQYVKDEVTGKITMSQSGLISKIISTAGMEDCNPVSTPTTKEALSKDPEGAPMTDSWNYHSIVGMLLYLSNNTRPDLTFAVSQVARFCYSPKQSHAAAVKRIIRYLTGTRDKGTIFQQPKDLNLKCYVDADFCGLFNRDPPEDSSSAKSRTGYIILVGGCYLVAKSRLQSTIALSTSESEYYALSQAMRTVLPLRELLSEIIQSIDVPSHLQISASSISSTVFEDNSSALNLAVNQHVTSRTRHYAVKYHFFWSHVKTDSNPEGEICIEKIGTDKQQADYATKGMPKDGFVNCRQLNQGW